MPDPYKPGPRQAIAEIPRWPVPSTDRPFALVTDQDAATRLVNRISRDIAETLSFVDPDPVQKALLDDLSLVYRWLKAVEDEATEAGT